MNTKKQVCVSISPRRLLTTLGLAFILAVSGLSIGVDSALASPYDRKVTREDVTQERVYSPYAGRDYPDQVLFGDTHFHTNLSFDAGLVGTRLTMDEG